jgi:hypothetical protein
MRYSAVMTKVLSLVKAMAFSLPVEPMERMQ